MEELKNDELKKNIEELFGALIKKYGMDWSGEPLIGEVYFMQKTRDGNTDIVFNDENMSHLIAGNVAGSIYDEMEAKLKVLGYEIAECDGSRMTLLRVEVKEPQYPNCEKLKDLGDRATGIHEFLEYLQVNGYSIVQWHKYEDCDESQQVPVRLSNDELINGCYGIDTKELEKERCALLESISA